MMLDHYQQTKNLLVSYSSEEARLLLGPNLPARSVTGRAGILISGGRAMAGEESLQKVSATPAARQLLAEIIADHGPVLFHQSGGCCDGSSPMCYPQRRLHRRADTTCCWAGSATRRSISAARNSKLWKHTDLTIDVVPGRGGMFSLDNGREKRFLTRSTVCSLP